MAQVHVTKRGNLFQYRFEIAPQGGTRKYIVNVNIKMLVILSNHLQCHLLII